MYDRLKRLYSEGKIDGNGIKNAVEKGWITAEEAGEIISGGEET